MNTHPFCFCCSDWWSVQCYSFCIRFPVPTKEWRYLCWMIFLKNVLSLSLITFCISCGSSSYSSALNYTPASSWRSLMFFACCSSVSVTTLWSLWKDCEPSVWSSGAAGHWKLAIMPSSSGNCSQRGLTKATTSFEIIILFASTRLAE